MNKKKKRYIKPESVEYSINFNWDKFPQTNKRHLIIVDLKEEEEQKKYMSPEEIENERDYQCTFTHKELEKYVQSVVEWMLSSINEGLEIHRVRINTNALNPFDRTNYDQHDLFEKAYQVYQEQIKTRRTYTYKMSLEDANLKSKIINSLYFDKEFENINRNYTNWRKNQKENRIT